MERLEGGFCSACFNHAPEVPHVDFHAENDAGWAVTQDGDRYPLEDLILCQTCLAEAADLIATDRDQMEQMRNELETLRTVARDWQHYAERTEEATAFRPEPIKRGPGRPPKKPELVA